VDEKPYQDIYARKNDEKQADPLEKKDRADSNVRKPKTQSVTISSLSDEELSQLRELQNRDRQVRNHETAHLTAAGTLAKGGIRYEYEQGPDGRRYVVDGSVQIDTSPGDTPEETIQKAKQMRAAALAANDPSSADMNVASMAIRMEMEARRELQQSQTEAINFSEGISEAPNSRVIDSTAGTGGAPSTQLESQASVHSTGPEHLKQCQECLQRKFDSSSTPAYTTNLLGWG